ncbi:hypothetical protein V8E54_009157 [Elaphomyces granulatus]
MPSNFNVGMRPEGDRQCLMSAQQNRSQKWVNSREYGREKQGVPWTAQSPRLKGHEGHQAGGGKAPCVHNESVIGIRLPASVREDNHDIRPCTLEPPLLLSEEIFDASIHTPGAMASKLGVGPSKMLATRQVFLRRARILSSVRDPHAAAYGLRSLL